MSEDLYQRLRVLREELKLTRKQLADKMGWNAPLVQDLERGKQRVTALHVVAFSEQLNVSANWLLFGHGPMFICDASETEPKPSSRTTAVQRKPFSAEEVVVEPTEEERDAAARMLAANIKMQFDNALENTPRAPSVVFLFLIGGLCGLWLLIFKLIGVL